MYFFLQDQAIPGKGLPANLVSLMSKGALGATKLTKETSKMEPHQTPAERQQAAKLALRKQLEKTLLQVIFLKQKIIPVSINFKKSYKLPR